MSEAAQANASRLLDAASDWWSTDIIDIHPGSISIRGFAIQDLIGRLTFPQMICLMLRGAVPTRSQSELLEAALVAAVDHGPQAPSIAISRMAVTCGLPINGAMASAINALDDIHGGAGQQCMELLEQIAQRCAGRPIDAHLVGEEIERYTAAHGKIIPGFGHRFHPVDPRAVKLLSLLDHAKAVGEISGRYAEIGRLIENVLTKKKSKPIPMNIDGVTAVIYRELGFPSELGRGLFILSRSVGILAHAWEQSQQGGRIKGPMPREIPYRYTGPQDRRVDELNPLTERR